MEEALLKAKEIYYNKGNLVEVWLKNNLSEEYGRNSVLNQVERIKAVELLGYPIGMDYKPKIVGYHISKSVKLPVFCLKYGILSDKPGETDVEFYVFIRDNFYDIKMVVVSDYTMDLPYDLVHHRLTEKQYKEEKQNAINCEGINQLGLPSNVFLPYENDKKQFTICKSWLEIPIILQHLKNEMSKECSFRRYGKEKKSRENE